MTDMKKHIPLDDTVKDLDNIMSRVNGLEVSSTDEYQRAMVRVLKTLIQGEINLRWLQKLFRSNKQMKHWSNLRIQK